MRYLIAALMIATGSPAASQELAVGVHASWLGIGGGTATTSRITSTGLGARVLFTPPIANGHLRLAAQYSAFPRDDGSTPPIAAAGVDIEAVANPDGKWRPSVGLGIGMIRFRPAADEFPPCTPELGCMNEGGAEFRRESATTLRPSIGVAYALSSRLLLTTRAMLHLRSDTPWNGTHHQPELSAGLSWRLR